MWSEWLCVWVCWCGSGVFCGLICVCGSIVVMVGVWGSIRKAGGSITGELFYHYSDWKMERMEEYVFDCDSGGARHQHCMDVMIGRRPEQL